MANEQNLIPLTERSKEDAKRIRQKGADAANRVRREKSNLRGALRMILSLQVTDDDIRAELDALGIETTMEQALALQVVKKALERGDHRALETIMAAAGEYTGDEQEARIEKMKAETEKTKAEIRLATQTEEEQQESIEQFKKAMKDISMDGVFDDG